MFKLILAFLVDFDYSREIFGGFVMFFKNHKYTPGRIDFKSFICLQEAGVSSMTICVKDLSGTGSKHDPVSVSYVVIGGWYFVWVLGINYHE